MQLPVHDACHCLGAVSLGTRYFDYQGTYREDSPEKMGTYYVLVPYFKSP